MKKGKDQTVRAQFKLGEKSIGHIETLKERVEPQTNTEAVRTALRIAVAVSNQLEEGNKILIQNSSGDVYPARLEQFFE